MAWVQAPAAFPPGIISAISDIMRCRCAAVCEPTLSKQGQAQRDRLAPDTAAGHEDLRPFHMARTLARPQTRSRRCRKA
jgi:hypothetical protein